MNIIKSCSLALPLLLSNSFAGEPDKVPAVKPDETISIFGWWGVPLADASEETYREMAEAGFTLCLPPEGDAESNRRHLDLAKNSGVRLLIQDTRMEKDPESVATDFKDHPALGAYLLQDEPNADRFPKLAELTERLRKADPAHPSYVNLLPNYATPSQLGTPTYLEYVTSFLTQVKPDFLSYDNYAITGLAPSRGLPNEMFFTNMALIREEARKAKIPFRAFVHVVSWQPHDKPLAGFVYGENRPRTEGELRFQVFSTLAYGAKGIQYFTYATPVNRPDNVYSGGTIDENGKKSTSYYILKKINSEIHALAPVLSKFTSLEVFHSRPDGFPEGKAPAQKSEYLQSATGNVVVGTFRDESKDLWMLVANSSFQEAGETKLTFVSPPAAVVEVDKTTGKLLPTELSGGKLAVALAPGDGRLFRLR